MEVAILLRTKHKEVACIRKAVPERGLLGDRVTLSDTSCFM